MLSPLYGQLSPLRIPTRSRFISNDSDVAAYILAVEAADGQQLEEGVITAVESFIVGCKTDGIWNAIKASCILAGARTLSGALVPFVGTAPTNLNFVSADYNRRTGLVGNSTTKYLNANRNNNADPQNSFHSSIYIYSIGFDARAYIGAGGNNTSGTTHLLAVSGSFVSKNRSATNLVGGVSSTGFFGHSRNANNAIRLRHNAVEYTASTFSAVPYSHDIYVFARGVSGTAQIPTNGRISFYSIGESINLALLDTRVSTLMTALAAAIP